MGRSESWYDFPVVMGVHSGLVPYSSFRKLM